MSYQFDEVLDKVKKIVRDTLVQDYPDIPSKDIDELLDSDLPDYVGDRDGYAEDIEKKAQNGDTQAQNMDREIKSGTPQGLDYLSDHIAQEALKEIHQYDLFTGRTGLDDIQDVPDADEGEIGFGPRHGNDDDKTR